MANKSTKTNSGSWLPTVTEFGLDSGLKGIFIDIPNAQSMLLEISFRAGTYLCPDDKPDLSHFLEHLLLGANEDYPSRESFSRAIYAKGGYRNASTGSYNVRYHFLAPDFDWLRTLGLMMAAVSKPSFLPSEFASEKQAIREEHRRSLDDHLRVIRLGTNRAMGKVSFGPDELLDSLDSISVDNLKDYYRQTYTLSNARVILSGHLPADRQQMVKQKLSGLSLPVGAGRPAMPSEELVGAGMVVRKNAVVKTTHYQLSFSNESLVLDPVEELAMYLLGVAWLRPDGRVYGQARDQGLIYGIHGGVRSTATSSFFPLFGQASSDNLEPLIDLILTEIERLLVGDLSDNEIDDFKDYMRGSFQIDHVSPQSWAGYYRNHYLDRGLLLPADYQSRLGLVNKDMVLGLAQKIFGSFDWTLGLLGDVPEETRKQIETKLNRRKASK